jgi:hypothetical protein
MYQMQIPIGQLPINLVLLSDGTLVFIKVANFGVIFDHKLGGVDAIFHEDSFTINGTDYFYNTIYAYKEIPEMLQWLAQQNLQWPETIF